ncbi:mitogen-activated protein kinase kinase kinase kinase 5-like [Denticeps clupeoides]|uniref:mitogen-activated protein kinase kinase kinase kinase 5-like n=1 Tax=Denticeps clupeoides TaxID=299321 RepID=UPI0010A33F6E|nr:mitogen-activated protein kinase kinase kinase kinase 5-like [Denticeps clupeoides]
MDVIALRDVDNELSFIKSLGHGGFGVILMAQNLHSGEIVAVKTMQRNPGAGISDPLREICLMKECDHENVIKFHGAYCSFTDHRAFYIAMELCGGGSLCDLYEDVGAFHEEETAFVCREVLKGLKYLHGNGILHRDIKGDNILVTDIGDVKICEY